MPYIIETDGNPTSPAGETPPISDAHFLLADDLERFLGHGSVRIGDVTINRIGVWRHPKGKLRVVMPSYRCGLGFQEIVSVPRTLRAQVEAVVLAAYEKALAHREEIRGRT